MAQPNNQAISRTQHSERRFEAEIAPDGRTSAQRDRDRVLYASAFARLAEITQVVSPQRGHVFHNRLTHSLKVGQISRRLAEHLSREQPREAQRLGGIDPDAAEAAGLAHDLGHPPFGHIAEEELNKLVKRAGDPDGYEGNAQSFRIVTVLANSDARDRRDLPIRGLNLTRMTLDGVLKYPWPAGDAIYPTKWGYYRTEEAVFKWVRQGKPQRQRSVIAEIMDWADDITFAIHDLLDFYCAGKIPIDRCKADLGPERERLVKGIFKRKKAWLPSQKEYLAALDAILEWFPFDPEEPFHDSTEERARLFASATALIQHLIGSFRLTSKVGSSGSLVEIDQDARRMVEILKQFIWEYVIENSDLAVSQSGQRAAVRNVFEQLLEAAEQGRYYLFPSAHQELVVDASSKRAKIRAVADCISGMTEKEVMHIHRCLQGLA